MKNKMFMFLALNSLAASFSATVSQPELKYEKLYNNMIKNIETGKSNDKSYKLIEDVLDKRNKELKDLYLQSDYIVKPEFLEWQIFFTGFYNNSHRGGNKESISTTVDGEAKNIDLGIVIPIKGLTRENVKLNLTPPSEPIVNINVPSVNINDPVPIVFTPVNIVLPTIPTIFGPGYSLQLGTNSSDMGQNTNIVAYNTTGTKIYENLNVNSVSGTTVSWNGNPSSTLTMTGVTNYSNGAVTGATGANETHTGQNTGLSIINIGVDGDFTVNGDWSIEPNSTVSNRLGFLAYRPNYITSDSSVIYDGTLKLSEKSGIQLNNVLVGMSLNLNNSTATGQPVAKLENKKDIIISMANGAYYGRMIGMQLDPIYSASSIKGELINSGKITIEQESYSSSLATAILINNGSFSPNANVKIGNIDLKADSAKGLEIGRGSALSGVKIDGSDGVINAIGQWATAVIIGSPVTGTGTDNLIGGITNLNIYLNNNYSTGITLNPMPSTGNQSVILDDKVVQSIVLGDSSSGGVVITNYTNSGSSITNTVTIDSSLANVIDNNKGKGNIVILNADGSLKNYMPITIGSGTKSGIAIYNGFTSSNSYLENYGDITINSTWDPNVYNNSSIALGANEGILKNFANITLNTDSGVALYGTKGTVTSNTGNIEVNGDNSMGLYATTSGSTKSNLNLESGNITLNGSKGALFFSYGGNIGLGSTGNTVNAVVNGEDSYLFYRIADYNNNFGNYTVNGNVNSEVTNGATAFYYTGTSISDPVVDLSAYLSSIINVNNGTINVDVDNNSYLFAITKTSLNVSSLGSLQAPGMNLTGSKKAKMYETTLNVDIDSNLDYQNNIGNKLYRDIDSSVTNVTINPGITVEGTEDKQAGISQEGEYRTYLNLINNGTINFSGKDTVGIYGKETNIVNNNLINLENSENGIGLYGKLANSSLARKNEIFNAGNIKIGKNGIGIYADTKRDYDYYTSSMLVNNSGNITGAGDNAVGIYINNVTNSSYVTSTLTLNSTSNIDVKNSKNGIGIYADTFGITGTNAGTITVGENGVGVYVKNGTTTLNNLTLNLHGDNTVGIYTDGTNSFTGNGTVNVDGKGVVVFNVLGSGAFNQNFNITSTSGSSYTLANIKDTTLYSNSNSNLAENGIFINGNNSAVLLGLNSNLSSTGANIAGIALNGAYSGGIPVTINGEILNQEATNQGIMSFGDNSTGIYVVNGASAENQGTITLGDNSVGIYGKGIGTGVSNISEINIGGNSVGLFLQDGKGITNSGDIKSLGEKTVGIYFENINSSLVSNLGNIILTGDKSVGIYATGAGAQTINNIGTVQVGDSTNESDPSIGIYNDSSNNIVNNSGDIISGKDSIGIYNNGGQINQSSGKVKIGDTGVGIYTDSGSVNLSGGILEFTGTDTVGIYGINGALIDNSTQLNIANRNYGIVLNSGAALINRNSSIIGDQSVLVYSDQGSTVTNELGADLTMTGSNSSGFYMINGGDLINKASITGNTGTSNIGIYNQAGSITNSGDIKVGDSVIVDTANPFLNSYSVGIYGEDVQNITNSGNIEIGADAVGFYVRGNVNDAVNTGNISSSSERAIGIYGESGVIRNTGNITLSGEGSIGIAAARTSTVSNAGTVTMNGNESIGIYANANSKVVNENTGKIYINGNNSIGVQLSGGSVLENNGLIQVASGTIGSEQIVDGDPAYTPPSIINAGIIKVDEKFDLSGVNIVIRADSESFRAPTIEEITVGGYAPEDINAGFLLTNTVSIVAPSFNFGDTPIGIDPLFTQGTNARVYKFENVFDPTTPDGGPNTGEIAVKSGSLTFDAIPVTNDEGKIDVWMEKIDYDKFTQGAWYDGFAKNIEGNYLNATGEALKLYDKLDLITDVNDLRNDFSQLSGSMYANITQREQNIGEVFNNTLEILQNSENNTKENVKINIIAGKGSTKEDTSGVESYDYETTGVLALREVERTYRHKFGYSLGYTRTDFQMKDTNDEDQADTIQLGLHNKYSVNGWNIKNDLLGRVSFHDVDRSINWSGGTKSDLNSNYNVYGVSSLNELGKDLEINRNMKVTPYVGLELGYMMHSSFEEKGGVESLKVDSNDAYSVKPNIGVRLEGEKEFGATSSWKVKGNIGVGYEYELGNMNNQEKASLTSIEDGYHELAKVAEDKGRIKTSGYAGVELKGAYGIYVTGEYGIGQDDQEDYKLGLSLKAMF